MEILNFRRQWHPDGRDIEQVGTFDVQLTPDCRILGCRLMQAKDGKRLVYGPISRRGRAVTFSRTLAEKITEAASANEFSESA